MPKRYIIQNGFHYKCRLRIVGVLLILLLSVLNVLMMLKLLHSGCTRIYLEPTDFLFTFSSSLKPSPIDERRVEEPTPDRHNTSMVFNVDPRLGRWDSLRQYQMIDQALVGARYLELSDEYPVCLATQSSIRKMHSLVQVSIHWSGPISMALFVVSDDEYAIAQEYVKFARQCFPEVRNQVSFHLAFPKGRVPASSPPQMKISQWNCKTPKAVLQRLLDQRSEEISQWHLANPYPQNHMRNLARKNCQAPQVFMTDIDTIPSFGAAEGLKEFFSTVNCSKCAFVVPTYEISTTVGFPKNKLQLVHLSRSTLARPFHRKVFVHNSFATNHSRWEEDTEQKPVHVSHTVTDPKFYYEPFYIATDTAPPHDERFIGYGLTKNTQVYEMVIAGFAFSVLSPIFLVHWGLQDEIRRPMWREQQSDWNYKKLFAFRREIYARYNYRLSASSTANMSITEISATSPDKIETSPNVIKASEFHQGTSTSNKLFVPNYRFVDHN